MNYNFGSTSCSPLQTPLEKVKSAVKTLGKLSEEMDTMGIKCFPVVKLAMALPAYFWDLEKKEKKQEKKRFADIPSLKVSAQ